MSARKNMRGLAIALALVTVGPACGGAVRQVGRDAPYVEVLRIRISKVRNAIDETRQAIILSRGAQYLPELYLRLGELLSEEARYHYRVAFEREQRANEALHVPQVRLLKEEAINVYTNLLNSYPDTSIADRVLFNIAHEHRELGNYDQMVSTLQRLVREHPTTPLRFEALLVLGDYHFDRSQLQESKQYYEQIAAGELNPVTDLAHYKLAWVYVNTDDCARALTEFERAIMTAREIHGSEDVHTDAPPAEGEGGEAAAGSRSEGADRPAAAQQGIDVRRAAITDLAYCYSTERQSTHVLEFYRRYAHDRATYIAGLNRISRRYQTMNEVNGSLAVARELLRLAPASEDLLDEARILHTAIRGREQFPDIGRDIELILNALVRYVDRVEVTFETRTRTALEFDVYIRDLLTRAQTAMGRQPEGNRRNTAQDLARGYQLYLDEFTPTPETTPELRRAYLDMQLNSVEVLATAGRPYEAGARAMEIAQSLREDDQERQGALYDAVVHFNSALETATRPQVERVVARSALRRAAGQLLRYGVSPEQERRAKFAVAHAYYDEGNYREAIDRLSAVAYEFPQTRESTASIDLVLDSYNQLSDYDGLMRAGARFLAEGSPADAAQRARIQPLVALAEQRRLDEVSLAAAGDEGGNLDELIQFANSRPGSAIGERALVNAFVAARAQGNTEGMNQIGNQIAQQYPRSEQAPGILGALGQTAVARLEFDSAVERLGQAAQADPTQRPRLLLAEGQLREQLGDFDGARRAFEESLRAANNPGAQAEPLDRLAMLLERRGDPRALLAALEPHASIAGPEVLARIGLAQLAAGQHDRVEATMQQVLNSGTGASPEAMARAHYGMAEALMKSVEEYPAFDSPDLLQEYITIVDVVQQAYLNAVRQGSADFTAAALGRVAHLADVAVRRIRGYTLPSEIQGEERDLIEQAMEQRAQLLASTQTEAITACAEQAWTVPRFSPSVRACLRGQPLTSPTVSFDTVRARGASRAASNRALDELRQRVSQNPEDVEGLREIGAAFLLSSDPHSARVALSTAIEKGGGPDVLNLLGIANEQIGDVAAAAEAFFKAGQGGLEAGRQNLAALLRRNGLDDAARTALERIPAGRAGGQLLQGAGGGGGGRGAGAPAGGAGGGAP